MSKTNVGLVEYVKTKIGLPYVYGPKMEVLTKEKYDWLKKTYGSSVWDSDVKKVGKMCCDCSGLISAYTGKLKGSSQMRSDAKQVYPISTVNDAPIGALVWLQGHIGVYIGLENGVPMYIAEDGSAYGCRKNKIANAKFTHWFRSTDLEYLELVAAAEKYVKYTVVNAPSGLRIRTGAGIDYTDTGIRISNGSTITALEEKDDWIRHDLGWSSGDYLKKV